MIDIVQSSQNNQFATIGDSGHSNSNVSAQSNFTQALQKGAVYLADAKTGVPNPKQAALKAHLENHLKTITSGEMSSLEQVAKLPDGEKKSQLLSQLNQQAKTYSEGVVTDVMTLVQKDQAASAESNKGNPFITAGVYGVVGQVPTTIANYSLFRNWGQVFGAVPDSLTRDFFLGAANYSGALKLDESQIPKGVDPALANSLYSNTIASGVASFTTGAYGALSPKLRYPTAIRRGIVLLPPAVGGAIYGLDKAKENNVFGLYKPERNENGNLTSWKDWTMENVTTGVTAGSVVSGTFGGISLGQHLGKIPTITGYTRPPVAASAAAKNPVFKAADLLVDIFIRGGKKGDIPTVAPKAGIPTRGSVAKAFVVPLLTVTAHVATTKLITDAPEGFWGGVKDKLNAGNASITEASMALGVNMIDYGLLAPLNSQDHGISTNVSELVGNLKHLMGLGPKPEIASHRMLPQAEIERYEREVTPMARKAIRAILDGTPQNDKERLLQMGWAALSTGGNGMWAAFEALTLQAEPAAASWNRMVDSGGTAINNLYSVAAGGWNEIMPDALDLPTELNVKNPFKFDLQALKEFMQAAEEDDNDMASAADPSLVSSSSGPGGTATAPGAADPGTDPSSIFKNPFKHQGALQTGELVQGASIINTGEIPPADLSTVTTVSSAAASNSAVAASELPDLQQVSYAQFSQLSPADQQSFVDRAVEYRGLSTEARGSTSLYQYANSELTSPTQRQQLQSSSLGQSAHDASLSVSAAKIEGSQANIGLIKQNIAVIQANTQAIAQSTQNIEQSNAARLPLLSTPPTSSNPAVAAFVAPSAQAAPQQSDSTVKSPEPATAPIPRFMVVRTAEGPRLMENLPNGQSQMLPFMIPGNTPVTKQASDGSWANVPNAHAIAGANMLDIIQLYTGVKMLNGGAPINAPSGSSAPAPAQPQLQPALQPAL